MSNTSRRRGTTSPRRVTLAAGAILAGAAIIPLAAAGTAWADGTETVSQLEAQGLSATEAKDVAAAEMNGTPVQVSYDGETVVNANNAGTEATATSGTGHDVAAAIGDSSSATATGGTKDLAFADGTSSTASVTDASASKATATGTNGLVYVEGTGAPATHDVAVGNDGADADMVNASYTTATATGANTAAQVNVSGNGPFLPVTHDRVVADGGEAFINDVSDSKATATDGGSAQINFLSVPASVDTHDVVAASGTSSHADIEGASNSTVTASTGGYAYDSGSNSTVTATGANSTAEAEGPHDVATAKNGGTVYEVDASYTTATATGTNAAAEVNSTLAGGANPLPVTHDRLVAGASSEAFINDASDSKATAAAGGNAAFINNSKVPTSVDTSDVVAASGTGSHAGSYADIEDASDSSNVVNNGSSYTIEKNDTHWVNGKP
jgi:trimeric autotransporter adhesin